MRAINSATFHRDNVLDMGVFRCALSRDYITWSLSRSRDGRYFEQWRFKRSLGWPKKLSECQKKITKTIKMNNP